MSSGRQRSKRTKKGSARKVPTQARDIGGKDQEVYVPSNRRDRRQVGQRSTVTGITIGTKAEPTVKDMLAARKQRKPRRTGQPEHFQRWTGNRSARQQMLGQSPKVLEPELGKQVNLLHDAGYTTVAKLITEVNYTKLLAIKGIGPAFLGKLRAYLLKVGFDVSWTL